MDYFILSMTILGVNLGFGLLVAGIVNFYYWNRGRGIEERSRKKEYHD